jgi:hypothetical protein
VQVELRRILARRLLEAAEAQASGPAFEALSDEVVAGQLDPWEAVDRLLDE